MQGILGKGNVAAAVLAALLMASIGMSSAQPVPPLPAAPDCRAVAGALVCDAADAAKAAATAAAASADVKAAAHSVAGTDVFRTSGGPHWFHPRSWSDVPGISLGNVELKEGDLVRLTLTGSMGGFNGRSCCWFNAGLRFTFNGNAYLPEAGYLMTNDADFYNFPPVLGIAKVGSGATEIPPGTYTIRVQAYTSSDLNALCLGCAGPLVLYVERTRLPT